MEFDVVVGNPPYQIDTNGSGRQATPVYQKFVEAAINLQPNYLVMIMPARWYSGGFGLDSFRKNVLKDKRFKELYDFESASKIFPGVDIAGGVCYFLWDKNYNGQCKVVSSRDNEVAYRDLDEFDIFVRDNQALNILRKILKSSDYKNYGSLIDVVGSIRPFDIPTNYSPKDKGIPCWFKQKIGLSYADPNDIKDKNEIINKWKILIPKAPIAGQTDFTKPIKIYHEKNVLIARPGEICTESYIVAASFDSREEAENFRNYLFTKTVRLLILLTLMSQDVNKKNFRFVPNLSNFCEPINDDTLRKMWDLSPSDWEYIDERVKAIND